MFKIILIASFLIQGVQAYRAPTETIHSYDRMLEQYDSLTNEVGFTKRVAITLLLKDYFSGKALSGQLAYLYSLSDFPNYDDILLFPDKVQKEIYIKEYYPSKDICIVERLVEVYTQPWSDLTEKVLYTVTLERNHIQKKWKMVKIKSRLAY